MNKSIKIQFVTGDMMLYIAAYNNVIKSMWVYRVALIFRKKENDTTFFLVFSALITQNTVLY